MKRNMQPFDQIDNNGVMLGICIIGLAGAVGIWVLVKFCAWVLS